MPTTDNNSGSSRLAATEAWIDEHSSWLALGIILAAFAMRVAFAASCYLNPDEAQHFDAATPNSWLGAYQVSRTLAHPPLFILILHGILFLGRSELILRMPSVIGGTAALWITFAWIRRSLGGTPALAGLGVIALCHMSLSASTEVRQYGVLLFFVCAALYATDRTFAERSMKWAVLQGLFLLGALLTDYTSVIALGAVGFYLVLRSFVDAVPPRILITLYASQLFLAAVLGFLYFGQVRGLPVGLDYLQPYFYSSARETLLGFVWRALSKTFLYAAGPVRLSVVLMVVFLAGFLALLAGRTKARISMALLVISPFVMGLLAAIFHLLPFAGSRHQTYLLPFLAAGIAAAFACWPRGWAVPLLLLGVVIAVQWAIHVAPDNNPRDMAKGNMTAAVQYLDRTVPRGAPLFADNETSYVLRYYLGRNDAFSPTIQSAPAIEQRYGNYTVIRNFVWDFRADQALDEVEQSARAMRVPPGDSLWVVSVAWDNWSLASRLPPSGDRSIKEFGPISVIGVPGARRLTSLLSEPDVVR